MSELGRELERSDGRPYPAYRDLRGRFFAIGPYRLRFEHVQGDPFASPSRIRVDVPTAIAGIEARARGSADARRAAADFLHRRLRRGLGRGRLAAGSGKSATRGRGRRRHRACPTRRASIRVAGVARSASAA